MKIQWIDPWIKEKQEMIHNLQGNPRHQITWKRYADINLNPFFDEDINLNPI